MNGYREGGYVMTGNKTKALVKAAIHIGYEVGRDGAAIHMQNALSEMFQALSPHQEKLTEQDFRLIESAYCFAIGDQGRSDNFQQVLEMFELSFEYGMDDVAGFLRCQKCGKILKHTEFRMFCSCGKNPSCK